MKTNGFSFQPMIFKNVVKIPLKVKFLSILLLTTLSTIAVFYFITCQIFYNDKRMLLTDLNANILRASIDEINLELKSRIDALQILIPKIYSAKQDKPEAYNAYLSNHLSQELIRVRFIKESTDQKLHTIKEFKNIPLLDKKKIPQQLIAEIDTENPIDLKYFQEKNTLAFVNNSIRLTRGDLHADIPVITILLSGGFSDGDGKEIIAAVDLFQDFIRSKLNISELAQLYLITNNGNIISHSSLLATVEYAKNPYFKNIVEKIRHRNIQRESFEMLLDDENYLVNIAETGISNIFIVSQIKMADAFLAIKLFSEKTLVLGIFATFISTIIAILFGSRISSNLLKLRHAAEQIGSGNFRPSVKIRTHDEIASTANSFLWMASRMRDLVEESAKKILLDDAIKTTKLLQSTLLDNKPLQSNYIEYEVHHYLSPKYGGDIWEMRLNNNSLTAYVASAMGHGVEAAIVTAITKGAFDTLNTIYQDEPLKPHQILSTLNFIIHQSCKGDLLLSMSVVQIDFHSQEIVVASAGHEPPLCLRHKSSKNSIDENTSDQTTELLFARGERLGYDPQAVYEDVRYQLKTGDRIILHTSGITEATSREGKQFGERLLDKVIAENASKPLAYIKDKIIEEVEIFTDGTEKSHDRTLLLIDLKRKKESAENVIKDETALNIIPVKPKEFTPNTQVSGYELYGKSIYDDSEESDTKEYSTKRTIDSSSSKKKVA